MRITRSLAAFATVAALAMPAAPSHALSSLAITFTVDCANPNGASTGSLGIDMPSGRYLVTVAGACSFTKVPGDVPVSTCLHGLPQPCVDTGVYVRGVPGEACIVGVGIRYVQVCQDRGVWDPGCSWWFTVQVDGQCLTTVPHQVGIVNHPGGPMTAKVLDGPYGDNTGTFVVTAVWTPL